VHLALVARDADVEGLAVFLADRDDAEHRVLARLRDDGLVVAVVAMRLAVGELERPRAEGALVPRRAPPAGCSART
jgi:hypothetical protein